MANTDTSKSIDTLPFIPINEESIELIASCLEDNQAAVIHRHDTMDSPFGVEVTARRQMFREIPRLSILGEFTFKAATDSARLHVLRDRYPRALKNLPLGELGLSAVFSGRENRSARLSYDDARQTSVTTWFSAQGAPQNIFSVSNNSRDGNNQPTYSTPPKYSRETMKDDVLTFMKLLSVPHRVLGGSESEYTIDFVQARKGPRQRNVQSRRAKKSAPLAPEKNHTANSSKKSGNKAAGSQIEYKPRLSAPGAEFEKIFGLGKEQRSKLEERILTFQDPKLAAEYGVSSAGGILLYGPPGSGKTMTATAVSNEIGATIWQVDGADLIEKWVGQSAANTKKLFEEATEAAKKQPLVLFFDEIDSIVGAKDDSSSERTAALGEFKRSLGYIAEQVPNVLIIGTTNDVDKLDKAFMRAGRFDIKIYMALPNEEARLAMLMQHINFHEVQEKRIFETTEHFDFEELVRATDQRSGAEIAAIIKACRSEKFRAHVLLGEHPGSITHDDVMKKIDEFRTDLTA